MEALVTINELSALSGLPVRSSLAPLCIAALFRTSVSGIGQFDSKRSDHTELPTESPTPTASASGGSQAAHQA